jgi:DNA polymerase elongation subunit (family B)
MSANRSAVWQKYYILVMDFSPLYPSIIQGYSIDGPVAVESEYTSEMGRKG